MIYRKLKYNDRPGPVYPFKAPKTALKSFLTIVSLAISCIHAVAQISSLTMGSTKQTTYLLPDGRVLGPEKLDSLDKAWGEGSMAFRHNQEDDDKGIIHLVRVTDEMKQQEKASLLKREQTFAAMLNKPAPDFELTDLQGSRWSLKQLRGKIVVLNFWFTSCAPCIQEMPALNELAREYDGKNVIFLALTFNSSEQIRTFQKKRVFNYTLLPNSGEVDKRYHIGNWPTSIVTDKEGDIKLIVNSSPEIREDLVQVIDSLK